MKVSRLEVANFRGIKSASLMLPDHAVLIGDNNTGKSTILEALDLVLGPDRLSRPSPIDEHDFYQGKYFPPAEGANATGFEIKITATITSLTPEQATLFKGYVEWWDTEKQALYEGDIEQLDKAPVIVCLRVTFIGKYNAEEDDFEGKTFYTRSFGEDDEPAQFYKRDKQRCGFLYLRSIRTGSRALSLERGSLLDIILRLKEIRPKMWEATLTGLTGFDVAKDPEMGVSGVLGSIEEALKKYVPREWGINPHLRVSALTRRHLREVITAFIATGNGPHAAPYYRQGTGTINMLLLAMLSQIAADKQNVIFAMEEPETAIPPYAQKRIVHELRKLSAQSLFTSHSPYVLEEFGLPETVVLSRADDGSLSQATVELPASVKHKRYRQEFRTRFCEGLLSRRVLFAEGATEAAAIPAAAVRLSELNSTEYSSLEALGLTVIDAGGESQIADLAALYKGLGKETFAVCDKQSAADKAAIAKIVKELFMHDQQGFEALVLKTSSQAALLRFAKSLAWPPHLQQKYPDPSEALSDALSDYFKASKGNWAIADFLSQCTEQEMPEWVRNTCKALKGHCAPPAAPQAGGGNIFS